MAATNIIFVATKLRLSRQTGYLWQLSPMKRRLVQRRLSGSDREVLAVTEIPQGVAVCVLGGGGGGRRRGIIPNIALSPPQRFLVVVVGGGGGGG